jgi:alpha-1,3-mannosyltransferase
MKWRIFHILCLVLIISLIAWFTLGDVRIRPVRLNSGTPSKTVENSVDPDIYSSSQPPSPIKTSSTVDPQWHPYVKSVMDPTDRNLPRLRCPTTIGARYNDLRIPDPSNSQIHYFFALDLYNITPLLPRLMSSIVQAIRFLGPEACSLSVVEGRSDDGTYQILEALRESIESLGSTFHLESTSLNPKSKGADRIAVLSQLRNMALAPMLDDPTSYSHAAKVIFINDVAICPEDILELLYQHDFQSATMTCAFDWIHDGDTFYDVWVSRSMSGDLFFEVPPDSNWNYSSNLFWDHPLSHDKFHRAQPLRVFSCWGGMVTIDAKPFLGKDISFRNSAKDECYMGEPTLLAKDLHRKGFGRILAVPAVNTGYSDEETTKIKQVRGYVADHIETSKPPKDPQTDLVEWKEEPPCRIKCVGIFWGDPTWVPAI